MTCDQPLPLSEKSTRPSSICKHNIKSNRTSLLTLPKDERRILRTQTSADSDWPDSWRDPTGCRVDNVTIARFHNWRWIRWTRSRARLFRICCLAWHSSSIDVIPSEGEFPTAYEHEVARCLQVVREVEDKITHFALRGIGVEDEIEDCAEVAGRYFRPLAVWVGGFRVLGADRDKYRSGDTALREVPIWLCYICGAFGG